MSKIVVIGANHAGTAAVNTILDTAPDQHQVVVFDANSNISFLGCGMALWIGGQISGPEGLFYSSQKLLQQKGALVHMLTTVTKIDFDRKIVYAEGYDHARYEEPYEKLILATGSQPIIPDIPGKDLENAPIGQTVPGCGRGHPKTPHRSNIRRSPSLGPDTSVWSWRRHLSAMAKRLS